MDEISSFKELRVWQCAMNFVADVYRMQKRFPKEEIYGLGDQMRRAVVSIPSNIAEGFGRETTREYIHFLTIARGSLFEVQTQLELAQRLGYTVPNNNLSAQAEEIGKLLNGLISSLKKKLN